MPGRLLLAGTHSSVGKTTVTLGLLAALRARGLAAVPFKAGPDYIDPSLHRQAAGRPSRNLDPWLLDEPTLRAAFERGARDGDVAVVEGVMGLFDGIGATQEGSTAAVARALDCPVVLVLDVAAMSGTAAALVLGCQRMQPDVNLVGVILNRVGGNEHARSTAEAILAATGLPVLGSLPNDAALHLPERHLGLVPAGEGGVPEAVLERLASLVEARFDLAALLRLAESTPPLPEAWESELQPIRGRPRIAVGQDRAFGFYYQDSLDLLAALGAEVVPVSPLDDPALPDGTGGVYLGGGFPELYAQQLSANDGMRAAIQAHARTGRPIYAECGGLMALGRALTDFEGRRWPMFDLLPVETKMQSERLTIGYRELEALRDSPLLAQGARVRGHEFHWSVADPPTADQAAFRVDRSDRLEGFQVGNTLGSYVHLNLAGAPDLARRFVAACTAQPVGR